MTGRFLAILFLAAACYGADSAQESAWKIIDASLADSNSEHRLEALNCIGTIGSPDPEAIGRAESALQDKETLVREAAALTLGELKAQSSIPKLKAALQDKGEVAFAAAKALASLGDDEGRDFLIAVVAGERKDVQPGIMTNAMRKAKGDLHHPEDLAFMGAGDATGAMFGPVGMVFPAVKDTMDLKGKGAAGRAAATAYLAKNPDPYAITLLEWALGDDNQFVRLEAAKGLGQRGNSGSVQKLWPLLSDDKNFVRDMAAAAIIRIELRDGKPGDPADGLPQVISRTK
jgi:HEAT repeat protein